MPAGVGYGRATRGPAKKRNIRGMMRKKVGKTTRSVGPGRPVTDPSRPVSGRNRATPKRRATGMKRVKSRAGVRVPGKKRPIQKQPVGRGRVFTF